MTAMRAYLAFLNPVAERRPLGPDLCLGATGLFLWFWGNCFQAQLGASRQVLRLSIVALHWQPQWPALPWLLGVASLLLIFAGQRQGWLDAPQALQQRQRLRQLLLLTGGLLLLRLFSLWDPLCYLFPYLTVLWAPHATWALCASFLLFPQLHALPRQFLSTRALALALFLGLSVVYGAYTLYFCQMTMLHGDEGHYLRVTQSLLRDGDMDLANNLGPEYTGEFHITDFDPHKAPGSPPGKIHSVHPIGLSVLLLPAYWAGLHLWANPRLACSLCMALTAAGCAALAFTWLVRLGHSRAAALASVLIMACTAPFFLYCNQLYPEMPALLILLVALVALAHWQVPGGGYCSLGKWEPALLGGIAALLIALLFLHPRYLPLAGLLAAGVLAQVRHRARVTLPVVGAVAAVGGIALLSFNYAFSRDLSGPFLPGNAWESGALQPSTWLLSLPGHWLHATAGLVNASPVFLLCLFGLAILSRQPGRQRWLALGLYLATAGVNGLHPDWTFGFCFPARFLLTAMPVLLLGLALALPLVCARAAAFFLFLGGLAISWDGLSAVLALPEIGYAGNYLSIRAIDQYYPWDLHFFSQTNTPFPWPDLLFWLLLLAALYRALFPALLQRLPMRVRIQTGWLRGGALLLASLLPFLWSQADFLSGRLAPSLSPYISSLSPQGALAEGIPVFDRRISEEYHATTGHRQESGGLIAQAPQDSAGMLMAYYTPWLQPGVHRFLLAGARLAHLPDQVAGHLILVQRQTLPAVSEWGTFHIQPLQAREGQSPGELFFYADRTAIGYAYVEFSGGGALSFNYLQSRFYPILFASRLSEVRLYPVEGEAGKGIYKGARYRALEKGQYRVCFRLAGSAFSTFFMRQPASVQMAVYVAQDTTLEATERLDAQVSRWFSEDTSFLSAKPHPDFIRPQVESVQAPWWTALPWVGRHAYEVDFGLPQTRDVWFLLCYKGDEDLRLEEISLYQKTLSTPLIQP